MAVTVKPTVAEIIEEGQFQIGYFPNCGEDNNKYTSLIQTRIDVIDAQVKRVVGGNYTSTDDDVLTVIHTAEVFLTCGYLWQVIKNVMDSYDAEALPPEFVEPQEAAANRDYYKSEGQLLLNTYEVNPSADVVFAMPYFGTAGVAATTD
jgi:hypothetical protein